MFPLFNLLMILQMSLYIGNLSEHVRGEELERVFRRFGHCNVRMKREGYGFVVFDFPSDAEKALRALKGRNICGEPLTLMWSNKQPKSHFPKFARGGGGRSTYELHSARDSDRLGYGRRKTGFSGWRNHKIGVDGRGKSVDVSGGEERGYHQDDYDGEEKDHGGDYPDEGGGVVPNREDNVTWGEPTHDTPIDNGNGNAIEFDRYEPYHGYDKKHDSEDNHAGYPRGYPAANSQENIGRAQIGEETSNRPNDSKFQQTCYRCGDTGHKMRNCPKEHSSWRNYNMLDVRQDNNTAKKHSVEDENKFGSGSWVKRQSSGDALLMRHQRDKRRVTGSRHNGAPLRNESFPVTKETDRHRRKEYGGKKRSRNEIESPKRSRAKMSRRSVSSSLPSDYTTSRSLSNSQSSKSLRKSNFHSRSRSLSSRAHSSSSKLRSCSKSQNCRGKGLHSMRSSSPTSLSVSLNQPLPPPPNKIQLNLRSASINGTAPESVDHLAAQGQQVGSIMELENLQSKDTGIAVNGKAAVSTTVVDAMEKDQHVQEDNNENHTLLNPSDGIADLTKPIVAGILSPRIVKEAEGFQHSGALMMDNIPTEIQKPVSETNVNPHAGLSTLMSTEEMCMVLNNHGLELPKDYERNSTMDSFFGAARLWPWHIIYYRRLKKGPISTENYARRVAQNQEFGIVDKYIRSSSGWGEFSLENS